jgi:glutathione S-transferase
VLRVPWIGDDLLAGREYFFDYFTAPGRAFLLVLPPPHPVGVDISGFPNVVAHFKRMQERPSVQKLLAYEKEVNERLPRRPRHRPKH